MKTKPSQFRFLAAASTIALLAAGTAHADNSLTEAGTSVENTFTLDYDVGTVSQPQITNDPDLAGPGVEVQGTETLFTVDRKVDHVITATNSILDAAPGSTATLTFTLLNEGNDTQSYSFDLDDLDNAGGTFDAGTVTIAYALDADNDGNPDGPFDSIDELPTGGAATPGTDLTDDVPKGDRVLIQVSGVVAASEPDAATDTITITAQARDPEDWALEGASGSQGDVTAADTGANNVIGVAQNVLADDTGVAAVEADTDGLHAAEGTIRVTSPDLTAVKAVTAITETPAICATDAAVANAKAIPGACVEYTITVVNTGATATASNLDLQDILPVEVDFVSATSTGFADDPLIAGAGPIIGTPADPVCTVANDCLVQLDDAILAPGITGVLTIRALVK